MTENRKILFCSCGTECLVLEKYTESTESRSSIASIEDELCIALFKQADYAKPYSLWRRLKCACHILWTGEPYYDCVVLEREEVQNMIRWLQKEFNLGKK